VSVEADLHATTATNDSYMHGGLNSETQHPNGA